MRKFFTGLGVLTAVVFVAGAAGFFFLANQGRALDRASKAYVADSVTAIAAHWDADEFFKREGPELRARVKPGDIRALFDAAKSALGPLVEFRGSQGEAEIAVLDSKHRVSARYIARGRFQGGEAEIKLLLVKQGDDWMIEGFHINSTALMRRLVGLRS
jgi:hypothetical protein